MSGKLWIKALAKPLQEYALEVGLALAPRKFNTGKLLRDWDTADEVKRRNANDYLNREIARSTASINNTYFKVQISAGLVIGLIVFYLTVLDQKDVVGWLLTSGTLLNAASIVMFVWVTSSRADIWTEDTKDFGERALAHDPLSRESFRELRDRANNYRAVLLRNRRRQFAATWFLMVPGFVLAMMAWNWIATSLCVVLAVACRVAGRSYLKRLSKKTP